jgi:hypothetical protein
MTDTLELDETWINDFEHIDEKYIDYYLEDIYALKVFFIYINKDRDIEKVKHEKIMIKEANYVSREELLSIIKKNSNTNYSLISILKYNIDMDNDDVKKYNMDNTNYLTSITNIDAIRFNKTINMFQDLNNIFFIFCEKSGEVKNKTKRILLKNTKKKTIRNTFK